MKDGRNGRFLTLAGPKGIVVPVRDLAGRIVALQIRRDVVTDGPKYVYLSSTKYDGPSPGSPVHVPLGIVKPVEKVRVTEGFLKADVAYALSGVPTIGLPGVASWKPCVPVLKEMGCKAVVLAMDADAKDNPNVAQALAAIDDGLKAEGFAIELEQWPAPHKGIDDALAHAPAPRF